MVDLGAALGQSAFAIGALLLLTFLLSVPLKDVSIVDIVWGLAFVVAGVSAASAAAGDAGRTALMLVLAGLWGLRLASYIAARKRTHAGEDPRYARMRERAGDAFVRVSLFKVFLLQAVLAWVVVLPLAGAAASDDPTLGPLAYLGAALWLVGFVFEAGGDLQLQRFKADPANRGKVMDRGLWRFTRHPNYFGDCCVWWGLYAIALDGGAWWSVVSPLIMTVLLTRVSGKDLTEKTMSERPGYAEYVERTSGFVPLPPR